MYYTRVFTTECGVLYQRLYDKNYLLPCTYGFYKEGCLREATNTWFIDGLQPDEFRQAVRAHDTTTVDETCERIGDDITEFEGVLRVLGLTQIKGGESSLLLLLLLLRREVPRLMAMSASSDFPVEIVEEITIKRHVITRMSVCHVSLNYMPSGHLSALALCPRVTTNNVKVSGKMNTIWRRHLELLPMLQLKLR